MHTATVRLFDKAGNGVEDDVIFEILPIESPVIDSVVEAHDFDGGEFLWGHSLPDVDVLLRFFRKDGEEVFTKKGRSDVTGHWMIVLDQRLPRGEYTMDAIVTDDEGAQSYPSEGIALKVGLNRVSFGFIDISLLEAILIILLVGVFSLELLPCERKERFFRSFRFNRREDEY